MTTLTIEAAKKFFGDLYDTAAAPDLNAFDNAAIRLITRYQDRVMPGDKALGTLMMNAVMSEPKLTADDRVELTAAVMGNIKQMAVGTFLQKFPKANLKGLIKAAKDAGYEVQVLDAAGVQAMPRSVIDKR
ncbi:hypothetical protein [Pseudomonas soli]|uniref:hypothetical protein n=1 Tax=Pseudomonas soli TaxID=1306993 RepID=UPI000B8B25B8|nr:hypothetical protein [Pseudomonas soli]